jgi:drug/metabolite transporter (DMT)-like permease
MNSSYVCALGATFIFAACSVVFGHFSNKISVLWMNSFKAAVALIAFGIATTITGGFSTMPTRASMGAFMLSGFVGLNIGDIFLLRAFKTIGSARTLMIFSFQPLFLGVAAYFLFAQTISFEKLFAIFFMIACVFTLSYEKFRAVKRWEVRGPLYALLGVILDSCGILLTRYGFNSDANVTVLEGNFYRCLGAGLGFFVFSHFVPLNLIKSLKELAHKPKAIVIAASFMGTFVSLWLYLFALSKGHLATITAIVGTGPIFAAIIEAILAKKWPSKYLYVAFGLFLAGFYLLL